MGNPKGFITIPRITAGYRPVNERIFDFGEVEQTLNENDRRNQASRCMDCGVPFCQWGCPINNIMPEWQDSVYKGKWEEAVIILHETNNFPEFTGRVCPALCEHACTLNIHNEPVTIRENEAAVAEKGFELGYIKPNPPKHRTGKKVAVIGSGPSGLACADLLNKWGHTVTLFEKEDAIGGLLRYGIPDFKLNKFIIDRRLQILEKEGIIFKTNTNVGVDITANELLKEFDAVCIAIGAMKPRNINVPGRELKGIYFAMDYLKQQNKLLRGNIIPENELITAKNKKVLVIGGGDTGSDCVGTAVRQGATSITQIEILPKPPEKRTVDNPWPYWANVLRTSSSHLEGCERKWLLSTKQFLGTDGYVKKVEVVEVDWKKENNNWKMTEKEGSMHYIEADLVLLAMGFESPIHDGLVNELSLEKDNKGNIKVNQDFQTNINKVFSTGDAVMGASLVVRAIANGRNAAKSIHNFLLSS